MPDQSNDYQPNKLMSKNHSAFKGPAVPALSL